ncbi:MAG: hypothetical protein SOR88_05140 [Roseburia inulinivorans]|nr:hypothetical protein [Roseburia inulinivorans]
MQAIVEALFDTVYLISVITFGIIMIRKSKGNRLFTMFGIMAVLLGSGDAFHLVPRALALCTTGLENFTVQLGLGKWITSVTQTIVLSFAFYIPVVLWADVIPMIGMLMIPKTCAYVWTVVIGYNAMKKEIAW